MNQVSVCLMVIWSFQICGLMSLNVVRDNSNLLDQVAQAGVIESDQIIEGTRGKRISMRCLVKNVKNYKIAWYFNGVFLALNNIRIRKDKRISIENPQPDEWRLVIDSIDSGDEGYYSCRLTNGLKKLMFLKVGVPPRFIGTNNGNHVIVNTIEGENVTLSCEAEGNPMPIVYWYNNNRLLSTGTHLNLNNISRYGGSEYECVARNKVQPDPSRKFKININFKPTVKVMYNLMYHLNRRGELQIICEISGNPVHRISWYKDGIQLKDDGHNKVVMLHERNNENDQKQDKLLSIRTSHIKPHSFISKLRVMDININTNGVYECSANGIAGNVTKNVVVSEIDKSTATSLNEKEELKKGPKGDELTFTSNFAGRRASANLTKKSEETYLQNLESSSIRINAISQLYYVLAFIFVNFLIKA